MMTNYPVYQPQVQPQLAPQPRYQQYQDPNYLKGRPVTSVDEVRATPIDFDGSIFYFPDITNNRIYTKQINMDGTASFKVYELRSTPLEIAPATNNFVTREEFEMALNQIKMALKPPADVAAQF